MADNSKPEAPTVAEPLASPIANELAEHIELQKKEYGLYVAADKIEHGTARAYNKGDMVPIENAERLGYVEQGLVVKVGTKAHKELMESLGRPVS